ncbi:hypothetical protein C8F01DRAFT_1082998 [Mycena amicta]|nr:hypothetical protein C8F01DRAFT_1082998 [Mycena amicta]
MNNSSNRQDRAFGGTGSGAYSDLHAPLKLIIHGHTDQADYYPRGMDNNQNQERLGSSSSTNDFSFDRSQAANGGIGEPAYSDTTDNVGSGGGNFDKTTDSSNRTQFDTYGATPSTGDKLRGGTEKFAGKMKGSAGL